MESLRSVVDALHMGPQSIFSGYKNYLDFQEEHGDPRVDHLPLMSSPLPTMLICMFFVVIVKIVGPWFMKDRAPMKLNGILIVYNGLQVLLSAYIFYEFGISGWFSRYNYQCQPVEKSNEPIVLRMVAASYLYYISKFTEFFDTFFFVLRKKNHQISLLHVVHHGIMPFSVWVGVRFTPGGHSTFFGFLNTFVHVWMYLYYMIAAMGPQYQPYIWWKKHLTTLQMVQFVGIAVHSFQLCFRECDYPPFFTRWIGSHALLFLVLFSNFYLKAYINKKRSANSLLGKLVPCSLPSVYEGDNYKEDAVSNKNASPVPHGTADNFANSNGIANGHVKSNDMENGHIVTNGITNGCVKMNGISNEHIVSNGHGNPNVAANDYVYTNGYEYMNGYSNGIRKKKLSTDSGVSSNDERNSSESDYAVKGSSARLRKSRKD